MLFPVIGAVSAMWLLISPLIELETGVRALLAVSVGAAALVLAPLGIWSRRARSALAALGWIIGLANFVLLPQMGGLANFAVCGVALVVAGMAPQPVTVADDGAAARATPDMVPARQPTPRAARAPFASAA